MLGWLQTRWNRTALAVGVAVAAGLGLAGLLVPRSPRPGDDATPLPEIRLLGLGLPRGDGASKAALNRARGYLARRFELTLPDGSKRELYLGQLGAELDK